VAVGQIREEMVNIERLCEDPKTWVEGFRKIAEVGISVLLL
jgi:exocyst complex component 3